MVKPGSDPDLLKAPLSCLTCNSEWLPGVKKCDADTNSR